MCERVYCIVYNYIRNEDPVIFVYSVLCDFCVFCTGHFAMVPTNLTCPHCLQHFFFEHLFHLYVQMPVLTNVTAYATRRNTR